MTTTSTAMKSSIVLLLVLAVAGTKAQVLVPDFGEGPLHDDFKDFAKILVSDPERTEKLAEITLEYAMYDEEFQEAAMYLYSDEFKLLMTEIEALPEFMNLINYIHQNGVNIYDALNEINRIFNIDEIPVPPRKFHFFRHKITGGLAGFFQDIWDNLPVEECAVLAFEKYRTSEAFRNFVLELRSQNTQDLVNKVYVNPRFQRLLSKMKERGIDFEPVEYFLYTILGIAIPRSQIANYSADPKLMEDLMDFAKLVPVSKIFGVILRYTYEDEEVRRAIQYVYTEEYHEMSKKVDALDEYKALIKYLEDSGLDVKKYARMKHRLIGIDDKRPKVLVKTFSLSGRKPGMKGMAEAIEALLPLEELKKLYEEKVSTSEPFAYLVNRLKSDEYKKIVDALYDHEVYQEMLQKSKANGLDHESISNYLYLIFGFRIPPI